ncbi:hypothetical protein [Candidatus Fokinia crypta]|uniref:Glycoprotease family protein n=1 Tax=Candidatus Fokinia crypta TaxID=1920990 RepID=A0ABZ0UQ70_9RICK|nr:hypothetical protein [Candidatus Fokinia cryptica]WPX97849.1 Glycoprotease family protein [Candidatus Fokinia cryptica]
MLFIDTTSGSTSIAVMTESGDIFSYYDGEKNMQVERIAKLTTTVLEKASLSLNQIKYIGCNTGPGSFNSIRIGVSYANGILCVKSNIISIQLNTYQLCLYSIYRKMLKSAQSSPFFIGIHTDKKKVIMLLESVMPSKLIAEPYHYFDALSKIAEISIDDFIEKRSISPSVVEVLENELNTPKWEQYYLFGEKCDNMIPSSATGVALMKFMMLRCDEERHSRFFEPFYGSLPSSMKVKDS